MLTDREREIVEAEIEECDRSIKYWTRQFAAINIEVLKLSKKCNTKIIRYKEMKDVLGTEIVLDKDWWKEYDKLRKDVPKCREKLCVLRGERQAAGDNIDGLEDKKLVLEDKLAEPEWVEEEVVPTPPIIPKMLEWIDIDDSTGYSIWFDGEMYYPALKEEDVTEVGYKTLQIYLNYTFDTEKTVRNQRQDPQKLQAEMRIILSVRRAGKAVVDALIEGVRMAFEEYMTWVFGDAPSATRQTRLNPVPIFPSTGINKDIEEYEDKKTFESKLRKVLPGVMKIGAYFRLSNVEPNVSIEYWEANVDFYGEWAHEIRPGYGGQWRRYKEGRVVRALPFDDFDLGMYFRKTSKWDDVISIRTGDEIEKESVWQMLGRLMDIQEEE